MNQTKNKFEELFVDVELNAGNIIELQLKCIEERMKILELEGRDEDVLALSQEYIEWANVETGDNYGFLFAESLNKN